LEDSFLSKISNLGNSALDFCAWEPGALGRFRSKTWTR